MTELKSLILVLVIEIVLAMSRLLLSCLTFFHVGVGLLYLADVSCVLWVSSATVLPLAFTISPRTPHSSSHLTFIVSKMGSPERTLVARCQLG